MVNFRQFRSTSLAVLAAPLFFVAAISLALWIRYRHQYNGATPRLVWGSTPLLNNRHWSRAMKQAGFSSETFTNGYYASINNRDDWDKLLDEEFSIFPATLRPFCAFLVGLWNYDVFFFPADGFFIGRIPVLWRSQAFLFRLARKKMVFIPYGSDSYVYRRIRSMPLLHGLLASYPGSSRKQDEIAKRLDYWCRHAHACIPATMGMDGFGRWDVAIPSVLSLDLREWTCSERLSMADGIFDTVTVCHAPNHRGFKGSEFIIQAVEQLKSEGLKVELLLLEKMQNNDVRSVMQKNADILVEQLICPGHGLNGLEGMACGLAVVSNLEDENYIRPFRRWSYFSECPIVSATPENITDVLRKLVTRPELRQELGRTGRSYVEKYHGLDSAAHLFSHIIEYVHGRCESLINLYHPLLSTYSNRLPKIRPPLIDNQIVD